MSRQKPWTKTTVGALTSPSTISTCRSTPSGVVTASSSSYGSSPKGSPAYGSSTRCDRRTTIRSAATPTAIPAAVTPTIAPTIPARRAVCLLANRPLPVIPIPVIPTRHPDAAEPRHDLVVDGVAHLRPVVRGRLPVIARPEQHRHVTGGHPVVAAVEDDLVHAYSTGDRTNLAAERDRAGVAGRPGHPLGVPERHDRERRRGRSAVRVAVRDALPRGYPLGEHDPCPGGHRRTQPEAAPRDGRQPVHRDADAYQVEVGVGAGQRGRRVGDVPVPRR